MQDSYCKLTTKCWLSICARYNFPEDSIETKLAIEGVLKTNYETLVLIYEHFGTLDNAADGAATYHTLQNSTTLTMHGFMNFAKAGKLLNSGKMKGGCDIPTLRKIFSLVSNESPIVDYVTLVTPKHSLTVDSFVEVLLVLSHSMFEVKEHTIESAAFSIAVFKSFFEELTRNITRSHNFEGSHHFR
jgi:hypothetical protein